MVSVVLVGGLPFRVMAVPQGPEDEQVSDGRLTDHIGLGVLSARFGRDLVEEVINDTGVREKRRRLRECPDLCGRGGDRR